MYRYEFISSIVLLIPVVIILSIISYSLLSFLYIPAFYQCGVCLGRYRLLEVRSPEEWSDRASWALWRYRLLVLRDFIGAFLLLQLAVIVCGAVVLGCDDQGRLMAVMGAQQMSRMVSYQY